VTEQATFDRSDLERMDRKQLQAIATHLGEKGTSRARKADIVDQIIGHVETSGPAAVVEALTAAHGPDDSGKSSSASSSEKSDHDAAGSSRSSSGDASGPDDGDSDDGDSDDRDSDDRDGRSSDGGSDAGRDGDDNRSDGRGASSRSGSDQSSARDSGGRDSKGNGDAGGQGGDNRGGSPRGAEEGAAANEGEAANQRQRQRDRNGNRRDEQSENGNRRRRRRGRDRDDDSNQNNEIFEVTGLLDLREEGFGFLRVEGSAASRDDAYVSVKQSRQLRLRRGDHIVGEARPANRNEKNPALLKVVTVNGVDAEKSRQRARFDELGAVRPSETLDLAGSDVASARVVDLIAPIAKGGRVLIDSPPRAGATTLIKDLALAVAAGDSNTQVWVLLIGERPEDITWMEGQLDGIEVIGTPFDASPEEQLNVAELTIERAKRQIEQGQDVVLLVDGLTRLARTYNLAIEPTGRMLVGSLDVGAVHPTRRFIGAGRSLEEGGSLTLIATVRPGTDSSIDAVIAEELADSATARFVLDADLASRGVFPAIDLTQSHSTMAEPAHDKLRSDAAGAATEAKPGAGVNALVSLVEATADNKAALSKGI